MKFDAICKSINTQLNEMETFDVNNNVQFSNAKQSTIQLLKLLYKIPKNLPLKQEDNITINNHLNIVLNNYIKINKQLELFDINKDERIFYPELTNIITNAELILNLIDTKIDTEDIVFYRLLENPKFLNIEKLSDDIRSNFEEMKVEFESELEKLKVINEENSLLGYADFYEKQAKEYKKSSRYWSISSFILMTISFIVSFLIIYNGIVTDTSFLTFSKKILIFIPLYALSYWVLMMHLKNDNLAINYRHRSISARSFSHFLKSSNADDKCKNELILNASNMLLEQPKLSNKKGALSAEVVDLLKVVIQTKK